jgi:hypothetical protein
MTDCQQRGHAIKTILGIAERHSREWIEREAELK